MNILQMSVSAGILIVAVAAVRAFAINRLPKTMFIILWGIVLCRLIIPFSFHTKFGIYNLISRLGSEFAFKAGAAGGKLDAKSFVLSGAGYVDAAYAPLQLHS